MLRSGSCVADSAASSAPLDTHKLPATLGPFAKTAEPHAGASGIIPTKFTEGRKGTMSRTACRVCLALLSGVVVGLQAQSPGLPSTKNGDWPHYTADIRGSKYSPLDQI